jgi:hypothetical protein
MSGVGASKDQSRRQQKMSKQDDKYTISLAGEFMVAGELYRRGIKAAVTYGNAKKADVVAYAGDKALVIEVKSTSKPQWVIGGAVPSASENVMWVLVFLPPDLTLPRRLNCGN